MIKLKAEDVIKKLKLAPLPVEGGWFRRTWADKSGTVIYYLITPETWSAFHRLTISETWHFYAGDSVRQLQLFPDGSSEILELGCRLEEGVMPQLVCPAGVWQATRLSEGGEWALMGTTMSPPYTDDCVEFPMLDDLKRKYPDKTALIEEFE